MKVNPLKIFIIGLTSSAIGGMEYHNLGNYAIMEPFIIYLKREFPEAKISTSIQMSDGFCSKFGISSLRNERYWTYGFKTGITTLKDLSFSIIWSILKKGFHKDMRFFIDHSTLLSEISSSDLIIDFSGDVYGDNANIPNFLEDNAEIICAKILGKPVVVFIGSPGPFSSLWRRIIARFVLNKTDMITNRDPISSEILKEIGINMNRVYNTACPAFLFLPKNKRDTEKILMTEDLLPKKQPLVILILCGWNMPLAPFYKVPREKFELIPFVEVIKHILDNTDADILLMSHQNRTDDKGNLILGNDHAIIAQLFNLLEEEMVDIKRILRLQHLYDAASSKSIIGSADVLISGRIHGAVAGLSQCIPTIIIDYGHEPKAHKLRGFAKLVDVEDYVCNPRSSEDMIRKFELCWINRDKIKKYLEVKIPHIKEKAKENFNLLKKITP